MVEQRSSKPFAWVRFLLPLFIKIFSINIAIRLISNQSNSAHYTQSSMSSTKKPSFLHPNNNPNSHTTRRAVRFNSTESANFKGSWSGMRTNISHSDSYTRQKLVGSQINGLKTAARRQFVRQKFSYHGVRAHFNPRKGVHVGLMSHKPYRVSNLTFGHKLFFKMFSDQLITRTPNVSYPGIVNSLFWRSAFGASQFGCKSWSVNVLLHSSGILSYSSIKCIVNHIPCIQISSFLNLIETEASRKSGSTAKLYTQNRVSNIALPSTYTLKLATQILRTNSFTALFLKDLMHTAFKNSNPFQLGYWSRLAGISNFISRKLALQHLNITLKKIHRHFFSFYLYEIPLTFATSRERRRLIPELPLALRGSFWDDPALESGLAISDFWQNDNSYEVRRNSPLRLLTPYSMIRSQNKPHLDDQSATFYSSSYSDVLSRSTSKHFKQAFHVSHDDFSSHQTLLPVPSTSLPKNLTQTQPILKGYRLARDFYTERNKSTLAKTLHTFRSLIKSNRIVGSTSNVRDHFSMRSRGLNFYFIRKIKHLVRIQGSKIRRYLRRRHRADRTFQKILTKLGRGSSQLIRLSKTKKRLWRRGKKYSNHVLFFSKTKIKKLESFKALKTSQHLYSQTAKQFKIYYSSDYKPTIDALISNDVAVTKSLRPTPSHLSSDAIGLYTKTYSKGTNLTTQMSSLGSQLTSVLAVWSSPILVKYIFLRQIFPSSEGTHRLCPMISATTQRLQNQLSSFYFGLQSNQLRKLNVWCAQSSNLTLRKRLLRMSSKNFFSPDVTMWYYRSLVRFIENCTGRRVALHFGPFVDGVLTFEDYAYLSMWSARVVGFQKILGHRIFVQEALMLIAVSIRLKDPTFLANWIRGMLKRLSFWKYRLIFRYIKYVIRHLFKSNFSHFQFRGFKLRLKGKISVAGNARTRTLWLKVGNTSHSKMDNRVAYDLSYVGTFTGALGFKLWFFY